MKKSFSIILLLALGLLFSNCQQKNNTSLRIATAANMQFVIKQLTAAFTKKTNVPCEVIIGSSGKLTAQIKEGAPYDLFLSADMKYPFMLHQNGLSKTTPKILAYGQLILWSQKQSITLGTLKQPFIKHIAIANPKVAPYGVASMEVLQNFGIFGQLKEKLVYGESIAQVNQFVYAGVAEVGFTALSVVRSLTPNERGYWVAIPDSLHQPIEQGIVLLENNRNLDKEARQFYDFLFSEEGTAILEAEGYIK
ncbi:MAG: molybdate transport system substrate-binding protein [Polaribacter sp.]|jgi:molybdate transport system substrate-binding protein